MDEKEMKARKKQRKANKKKFLTTLYSKRIKDLLTTHKLKQYQLAKIIGVTDVTISMWRQKKSAPQPAFRDIIDELHNNGFNPLNYEEVFNPKKKRTIRIKTTKVDIIYYVSLVTLLIVSLSAIYFWR
jgi:DNA-binding transcriptional regulator YiaG